MTFTQWQNRLMTHFSEHIPVVKWCISVLDFHSDKIRCKVL